MLGEDPPCLAACRPASRATQSEAYTRRGLLQSKCSAQMLSLLLHKQTAAPRCMSCCMLLVILLNRVLSFHRCVLNNVYAVVCTVYCTAISFLFSIFDTLTVEISRGVHVSSVSFVYSWCTCLDIPFPLSYL